MLGFTHNSASAEDCARVSRVRHYERGLLSTDDYNYDGGGARTFRRRRVGVFAHEARRRLFAVVVQHRIQLAGQSALLRVRLLGRGSIPCRRSRRRLERSADFAFTIRALKLAARRHSAASRPLREAPCSMRRRGETFHRDTSQEGLAGKKRGTPLRRSTRKEGAALQSAPLGGVVVVVGASPSCEQLPRPFQSRRECYPDARDAQRRGQLLLQKLLPLRCNKAQRAKWPRSEDGRAAEKTK